MAWETKNARNNQGIPSKSFFRESGALNEKLKAIDISYFIDIRHLQVINHNVIIVSIKYILDILLHIFVIHRRIIAMYV